MAHGAVEVVAYQETLMIMAVFGVAVLAMAWAGFRRWLRYKETSGRLIAERSAESAAQFRTQVERVEARMKAIEQIVTNGRAAELDAPASDPAPGAMKTSRRPAPDA